MVRLRPHHLLCILTYVGRGYSPAFTANYDQIAQRMADGEPIAIVDGPDDICRPLLDDPDPHCHRASVHERDRQATVEIEALLRRPVRPGIGFLLDPSTIAALRRSFAAGKIRAACTGCEWGELCSEIAFGGFHAARIARRSRREASDDLDERSGVAAVGVLPSETGKARVICH